MSNGQMNGRDNTVGILQRAVQLIGSSLPMYVIHADLWTRHGQEHSLTALNLAVQDHQRSLDRLNDLIMRSGGVIEHPRFPASYTALNDVAFHYVLQRLAADQHDLMARLEALADALPENSEARDLVDEAAGAARGHAQSFEELAGEVSGHHA